MSEISETMNQLEAEAGCAESCVSLSHCSDQSETHVVVGMSGGVDSSVAAALLQRRGFEVHGVTCIFHDDENTRASVADAEAVCRTLGIEHHVHDCTEAFRTAVVEPFIGEYARARTPSPCVGCNATCKMPGLLHVADELGAHYIATGHYADIACVDGRFAIRCGDESKDQSYMLSMLTQEQLSRVLFPLEGMEKPQVRAIAEDLRLPVAYKAESQDICFIEGDYVDFLHANGVGCEPGDIVAEDGRVLGHHTGLFNYTLGQRKGIGIGGVAEPLFAIGKNADRNELVVGPRSRADITAVRVSHMNWQAFDADAFAQSGQTELPCMVKLRYRQRAVGCILHPAGDRALIELDVPQPITSPGQYAVFYRDDMVLGAGVIDEVVSA